MCKDSKILRSISLDEVAKTLKLLMSKLVEHDSEWSNLHGVAAFGFEIVFGCCDQFVVGPTHACGETLDLLMTDVPDLVRVGIVDP